MTRKLSAYGAMLRSRKLKEQNTQQARKQNRNDRKDDNLTVPKAPDVTHFTQLSPYFFGATGRKG